MIYSSTGECLELNMVGYVVVHNISSIFQFLSYRVSRFYLVREISDEMSSEGVIRFELIDVTIIRHDDTKN